MIKAPRRPKKPPPTGKPAGGEPVVQSPPVVESLPASVAALVRERLPEGETTHVAIESDISTDRSYGSQWIVATNQRLLIIEPDGSGRPGGESLMELPLDQIDALETHEFHGMGTFEIALGSGATREVYFSRSMIDKFQEARAVLEETVKQIKPAAFPEEEKAPRPAPKPRCSDCNRILPTGIERCPACIKKGRLLVRMTRFIQPYWLASLVSFLLAVALSVLELAPPVLFARLIDGVLAPPPGIRPDLAAQYSLLWLLIAGLVCVYVIRTVLTGVRTWVLGWLNLRIMIDLQTRMFDHLQRLSMGFYDRQSIGGIMARVSSDTSVINGFLASTMPEYVLTVLRLLFIGVILFRMNLWLAALVLLPAVPLLWMARWFSRTIEPVWNKYWQQWSRISTVLASSISGVRVVKGFAQEQREARQFRGRMHDFLRVNMRITRIVMFYSPAVTLVSALGSIVIWVVGGPQVIRGSLTLGELTLFTSFMWQFYGPMGYLAETQNILQQTAAAAERVFEIFDTEPEVKDRSDAIDLPSIEGNVRFEDVRFRYETQEPGEYVLKSVDLEAHPGELIGLVGHSGSGKTTLINLLQRFYDVTDGRISIDGHDLRDIRLKSLRQQIGVVYQEPFLFAGTIAENIAYGRPDATQTDVIEAAKAANAHRFIVRFSDGYDTEVGERGVKLSGGEKQRISIARAILNNPRLMILDEATSAVDTETEQLIQEALDRVMDGRTVFAIAHRLSTLKNATRLIVLDKGEIAEVGTHDDLMTKENGIYRKLVQIQTDLANTVAIQA